MFDIFSESEEYPEGKKSAPLKNHAAIAKTMNTKENIAYVIRTRLVGGLAGAWGGTFGLDSVACDCLPCRRLA